jgi:uncharacterized membrane protein (DUF485 family)
MTDLHARIAALAAARERIAGILTALMILLYFGFVMLVAFARPLLARPVMPGLTLGILLGALVIVAAWVLIRVYVRWANSTYDRAVARIRESGR